MPNPKRTYVAPEDQTTLVPPPEPPPEQKSRLRLAGASACLKSISVLKLHKGDAADKLDVVLSFDVPLDRDDQFPLADTVAEIQSRSEHEAEGKRTTKISINRNFETVELNLDDAIRNTNVTVPADVLGVPVITVLDGNAEMRVRLKATVTRSDFEAIVWTINAFRNWAFTPMQQTIPGVE